jgi:hypothetical protein
MSDELAEAASGLVERGAVARVGGLEPVRHGRYQLLQIGVHG